MTIPGSRHITRRQLLKALALTPVLGVGAALLYKRLGKNYPPAVPLTSGPNYHWFGYYDKLQFDPTSRYVLGMESTFENRSPTAQDKVKVGLVDLQQENSWTTLGESHAWNWQQGCMLQWRPHSSEVLWNDREKGRFVCHILDTKTGRRRTLPKPAYTLSPDGSFALGLDFARLDNMRPGYGYAGGTDPFAEVSAPEDSGIYRLDLETGEHRQLISLAEIAANPYQGSSVEDKWHYFNHLLISPDGRRFIFLNRFRDFPITPAMRQEEGFYDKYVRGEKTTRMYTAAIDGSDVYELDPSGKTSHFIWRDPKHVLAWTQSEGKWGFWLFEDKAGVVGQVGKGVMTQNGHETYLPGTNNTWILNDTYALGRNRMMTLYLYHIPTREQLVLGKFHLPKAYEGEWRTDLHPRFNSDGTKVVVDSAHAGNGRQLYLVDLGAVADAPHTTSS